MQELFSQKENIKNLTDYFHNPYTNICLLEGKAGSFKTFCVNEAIKGYAENADFEPLVFKLKCFESTTLDDIFLLFLETIKNYAKEKKLAFSKVETNDISQRINHYLANIKIPSVVVVDSLQNVFNNTNQKDKEEILRFLLHLASIRNYKLVFVSNSFESEFDKQFSGNNLSVEKIKMQALSREEVDEYFEKEHKEFNKKDLEKFYELSQGSPAELFVTSNILSTLNCSLTMLLLEYVSKQLPFNVYLVQKILTFVTDKARNSLECLSVFNGGLSEEYLVKNGLFTKEQIDYLLDKGLLSKEYGLIFVKSYIKNYLSRTLSNYDKNEYHKYWKTFYSEQLPLKPVQRAVLISRNTMRSQIEYHASHILKQHKKSGSQNLSLISYLNSDITSWNYKNTYARSEEEHSKKKRPEPPDSLKNKTKTDDGLEKYELTKNEMALLGVDVDISSKPKNADRKLSRTAEQRGETPQEPEKDLSKVYELAVSMAEVHNYETSATFFLQALDMKSASEYEQYHSKILSKLAFCCEKMNRTSDAIDFYNKLVDLYAARNDSEGVDNTKLCIAGIYKKTYKLSHARVIYEGFVKNPQNISDSVLLQAYAGLADIEMSTANSDKALEYYNKAFALNVEANTNELKDFLSGSYYNCAILLEEAHEPQKALEYYKKCVETSPVKNSNVSSSYTNIAEIMKDDGAFDEAVKYYEMAVETDTELSNYEGIYYVALKLAIMYEGEDDSLTQHWLLKSLSSAKQTKDAGCITNAYLELGDFYFTSGNMNKSLKSYLNAKNLAEKSQNELEKEENLSVLNRKIAKVQKLISAEEFKRIVRENENNE